jgi:hypothetical protein
VSKRTCPRCGGRKDHYAIVCRACKRPDEWAKPNLGKKGSEHTAWKGGRSIDEDGYVRLYLPEYRFARPACPYVYEQVKVIEDEIGRQLEPHERVHHKDLDRQNNARENLELTTISEHSRLHRALDSHRYLRDERGRYAGVIANA